MKFLFCILSILFCSFFYTAPFAIASGRAQLKGSVAKQNQGITQNNPTQSTQLTQLAQPPPQPTQPSDPSLSKIQFQKDRNDPIIQYANISTSDPLSSCPLDSMPPELSLAVKELVTKVRDSVSNIKKTRGDQCSALNDRMKASQSQLSDAMKYQFIANASISASATQSLINTQTQQAGALNMLVLTASDMMQRECITSISDKVVIQKLIGQIMTITGLFMGGWQGILIASGGQLFGNIPIFRDEIDKALEVFQKYDEINERGSFLCLYRQMQKTSCLLFATEKDLIINGLDTTFKTGPAFTTEQSIEKIKEKAPDLLEDIKELREIGSSADLFLSQMKEAKDLTLQSYSLFDTLQAWCIQRKISELKAPDAHPPFIKTAITSIQLTCNKINSFNWTVTHQPETVTLLTDSYWSLLTLKKYFESIRKPISSKELDVKTSKELDVKTLKDADPPDLIMNPNGIATTWESQKYFEQLKKSIEQYKNPLAGNSSRLNYQRLINELGNTLVKSSFTSMMKEYHSTLEGHKFLKKTKLTHSLSVRKRALSAMIDLCRTLDPTLACLYVDGPSENPLQLQWKKNCVGPKSLLCKNALAQESQDVLFDNTQTQVYFNSLCGVDSSGTAGNRLSSP